MSCLESAIANEEIETLAAEATVISETNQIESHRLYFHDVPGKVFNDVVRRMHVDCIQFKITRKEYCAFRDEDDE